MDEFPFTAKRYPIATIRYPDGEVIPVVLNSHLTEYTPKSELKKLENFLRGQTALLDGVYAWDMERYMQGKKVID